MDSAPILVRAAAPADVDAVAEIHAAARATYYRGRLPDALLDDPAGHTRRRAGWARATDASDRTVLCAERAGLVVGVASTGPPQDATVDPESVGELYQLHVRPGHWGQGIGSRLHDVCVAAWRDASLSTGLLEVYAHNHRARAFYERRGWQPDTRPGDRRHRSRCGPPHLRMRLDLRGGGDRRPGPRS